MIMTIEMKYDIGETVYMTHDTEQSPYVIVHYIVGYGQNAYHVKGDTGLETCYEFELSRERNMEIVTR